MKKTILPILIMVNSLLCSAAVEFSGGSHAVINEKPEASTGLDDIFVVYSANGLSMSYTASSDNVEWYMFSSLGGAYAEKLTGVTRMGNKYTLSKFEGDMGYYIEDNNRRYYFWVVDYSSHYPHLGSITPSAEQDCDVTNIVFSGSCDRIAYYTINGQPKTLNREIVLAYNTLEYDSSSMVYNQISTQTKFEYLTENIHTPAPLTDTSFSLSADKYLRQWGEEITIDSPMFQTNAISAQTSAEQEESTHDNERHDDSSSLGGSAPAVINFKAVVTDAVAFSEWQFSDDNEFENITLRMSDLEFTRTFNEQGTTYIRFFASNAAGTCDYYGDTYEVTIGESILECPNAFSPGATEGINDIWKVSYKSIIDFECHIFNRWGVEVCSFTDPSQGWDGKYRGKLVKSGVYFYVINAKGSDGRVYKLKGDINIINYKPIGTNSGETDTE